MIERDGQITCGHFLFPGGGNNGVCPNKERRNAALLVLLSLYNAGLPPLLRDLGGIGDGSACCRGRYLLR
ncbi:hypothetical protein [Streptomyces sp. DB-54]